MEKRQYEFEMSLDDPSLDEDQNQAGLKFSSIFFAFTSLAIYCYLYTNKIKWPILESPKKLIKAATWGVLCKKVLLEFWQNSQENTCARVFF